MNKSIIIDNTYNWKGYSRDGIHAWYIGSKKVAVKLIKFCEENPSISTGEIKLLLTEISDHFSVIVSLGERVISIVDKIRSYPVFYYTNGDSFTVSNSARALRDGVGIEKIDPVSLLEFKMAGYVTGNYTIYKKLYQLQAGEVIDWDGEKKKLILSRYFLFYPDSNIPEKKEADLVEELEVINNQIFKEIIDESADRPIWVPLSGGLDSRLVLCKLKQLGYKRLYAFSYGPPENYEMKIARYVAKKLDVKWFFVPSRQTSSRYFFHSETRKRYWKFADGLCSIPFMQDLDTLLKLRKRAKLSEDAIIINGQSGDFITGGHIPTILNQEQVTVQNIIEAIISKHFSLWVNLKSNHNIKQIIGRISDLMCFENTKSISENGYSLYERWEWQERQSKYVVNGQRAYDFLKLSWKLPLWDGRYLDFWKKIPLKHKFNQSLYKKYLSSYNYGGLFKDFQANVWRWPGSMVLIIPIAKVVQVLFGQSWKENLYKYATYFGHYRNHFAAYGFYHFMRNAKYARNVTSFAVEQWLLEHNMK